MAFVDPDQMIRALAVGMFPMAPTRFSTTVDWIEPKERAILPLDRFHMSESLRRRLRSDRFEVTADLAFREVVAKCAEVTPQRVDSWISPALEIAYAALFDRGNAHSVESWRDGQLVGGVFGMSLGGLFTLESMFTRQANASKVALAHCVARLGVGGYRLVDCQFPSPHMATFGAVRLGQQDYRRLLSEALAAGGIHQAAPLKQPMAEAVNFFAIDERGDENGGEARVSIPGDVIVRQLTHRD